MIKYKMASFDEFKQNCEELRQMHYLEVVAHRGAQYALNVELYEQAEEAEALRIIIGYDDTIAIGYMVNFVTETPHDDTRLTASMDLTFVKPEYRNSMIGVTLYKLAEADLQVFAPGALWRTATPIDGTFSNRNRTGLEKFGFKATERVYEKVLGGE